MGVFGGDKRGASSWHPGAVKLKSIPTRVPLSPNNNIVQVNATLEKFQNLKLLLLLPSKRFKALVLLLFGPSQAYFSWLELTLAYVGIC